MSRGALVEIRVLGPLDVLVDGETVELSPQLRRLLGVLIVAAPDVISAGRLAEIIADGRSEGSTVRTAVSRLRKVLGGRVDAADGGYRIDLDGVTLDLTRFEEVLSHARDGGSDRLVALEEALALVRGRAFGDLADEEWAVSTAQRIEDARRIAAGDLATAYLEAGHHARAIECVERLADEDPYRERPIEIWMRALHESGRTVEALRVFERFRVILRDDVGIDPSPALQQLEADLLAPRETLSAASARPLPDGTVTFLFTDIEGSTQRWQADETDMVAALAVHDDCLRDAVETNNGIVFKHTGDGICAVFVSAADALVAAEAAQGSLVLPVRMGLHTGTAERRGRDYFGSTLNRAARIMDAGHGGQILVSSATAALVADVELLDLGEHELKGLAVPERILQVADREFPALRTRSATKGNLPPDPTPFLGRAEQLDELALALADHRLVTLLGVGGIGKTRLSLEVARRLESTYPDGCWLVELAPVAAGAEVPLALATGLGIPPPDDGQILEQVIRRLRQQRLLLVVDNCEHLLEDVADSVEMIVEACPTVTVLATSREPLVAHGERLLPLPSLPAADAVALFEERARGEAAGLHIDDAQRAVIAELCERLDRLPLAIELAASQLRMMTPVELLESIEERFRLLVAGRRSRMERHRTMRSTLDWSYERCAPEEQQVFDRLSVFPSVFDFDGVQAVTADLGDIDHRDIVRRLIDRSLVQRVEGRNGRSAFRLLETMRAYGQDHLDEAGEAERVGDAHTGWLLGELGWLGLEIYGPDEVAVEAAINALVPDALAACDRLVAADDLEAAQGLVAVAMVCAQPTWDAFVDRLVPAIERRELEDVPVTLITGDMRFQMAAGDQHATVVERAIAESLVWTESASSFAAPPHLSLINGELGADAVASLRAALPAPALCGSAGMLAYYGLWHGARYIRSDVLEALVQDMGVIADSLDSEVLRRRVASAKGYYAELDGRWDDAFRLFCRAVDGVTLARFPAVQAGFGVIRARAMAGHALDPADFRRVWGWFREQRIVIQTWNGLIASAVALDRAGRTGHARRVIAFMMADAPEGLDAFVARIEELELLTFSLDDLPDAGGTLDEHIDEILAAVDEIAAGHA